MDIIEDFHGTCKELKSNTEFEVDNVEFSYNMLQKFKSFIGRNRLGEADQEITFLELYIDKNALKYLDECILEWDLQGSFLDHGKIFDCHFTFSTLRNFEGTHFSNFNEEFALIPNLNTLIRRTGFDFNIELATLED